MWYRILAAITLMGMMTTTALALERSSAPDNAGVYFIDLEDGDTVESPVHVRFGLSGMGVAPAGVEQENTGHHHLLVNIGEGEISMDQPLPSSDRVRHFGAGQTEAEVELEPGEHTLQLLLGDHLHIPHDPPVKSERITITVE